VLTPVDGQLQVRLYGDLAEIVAFSGRGERKEKGPASGEAGPLLSMVAGRRNHLYRTSISISR
jgi:hypothetical protein